MFVPLRFFMTSYRVYCAGLLVDKVHQVSEGPSVDSGSLAVLDSGPPPHEGQLIDSLSSSAIDSRLAAGRLSASFAFGGCLWFCGFD
jgi:hypothetical protein